MSPDAKPAKLSILVRGGRSSSWPTEVQRQAGKANNRPDGRFVFPGWADAHSHLEGLGWSRAADLRRPLAPPGGKAHGSESGRPACRRMGRGARMGPEPVARFGLRTPGTSTRSCRTGQRSPSRRWTRGMGQFSGSQAAGITARRRIPTAGESAPGRRQPRPACSWTAKALVVRARSAGSEADREGACSPPCGLAREVRLTGAGCFRLRPRSVGILERAAREARSVSTQRTPDPKLLAASFTRASGSAAAPDFLTVRAVKGC